MGRGLWRPEDFFGSGERIEFVDPVAYDSWCAADGGSPLLSAPADAAAIAQQVIADPNFETTAPVTARIGGVEPVSIDVALAPGGRVCGVSMIEISRWIHGLESGMRLRLYLVDLPQGMSVQTLAITVVAPEERFDDASGMGHHVWRRHRSGREERHFVRGGRACRRTFVHRPSQLGVEPDR